jgi:uncharacterized membrane protein
MGKVENIQTLIIFTCIILLLLSGFYWYYFKTALSNGPDWSAVIVDIISAVLLILLSIAGIIGIVKKNETIISNFNASMVIIFLFTLAQLIVTIYSSQNCTDKNIFSFICGMSSSTAWLYWFPMACMVVDSLIGFSFGFYLVRLWRKDDPGNYY